MLSIGWPLADTLPRGHDVRRMIRAAEEDLAARYWQDAAHNNARHAAAVGLYWKALAPTTSLHATATEPDLPPSQDDDCGHKPQDGTDVPMLVAAAATPSVAMPVAPLVAPLAAAVPVVEGTTAAETTPRRSDAGSPALWDVIDTPVLEIMSATLQRGHGVSMRPGVLAELLRRARGAASAAEPKTRAGKRAQGTVRDDATFLRSLRVALETTLRRQHPPYVLPMQLARDVAQWLSTWLLAAGGGTRHR